MGQIRTGDKMGDRRTLKRLVLDPERVIATLDQLHARIDERFPDSGLSVVCADLTETAAVTAKRAAALRIGAGEESPAPGAGRAAQRKNAPRISAHRIGDVKCV